MPFAQCPNCFAPTTVNAEDLGKERTCPACGGRFVPPNPNPPPVAKAVTPGSSPPAAAPPLVAMPVVPMTIPTVSPADEDDIPVAQPVVDSPPPRNFRERPHRKDLTFDPDDPDDPDDDRDFPPPAPSRRDIVRHEFRSLDGWERTRTGFLVVVFCVVVLLGISIVHGALSAVLTLSAGPDRPPQPFDPQPMSAAGVLNVGAGCFSVVVLLVALVGMGIVAAAPDPATRLRARLAVGGVAGSIVLNIALAISSSIILDDQAPRARPNPQFNGKVAPPAPQPPREGSVALTLCGLAIGLVVLVSLAAWILTHASVGKAVGYGGVEQSSFGLLACLGLIAVVQASLIAVLSFLRTGLSPAHQAVVLSCSSGLCQGILSIGYLALGRRTISALNGYVSAGKLARQDAAAREPALEWDRRDIAAPERETLRRWGMPRAGFWILGVFSLLLLLSVFLTQGLLVISLSVRQPGQWFNFWGPFLLFYAPLLTYGAAGLVVLMGMCMICTAPDGLTRIRASITMGAILLSIVVATSVALIVMATTRPMHNQQPLLQRVFEEPFWYVGGGLTLLSLLLVAAVFCMLTHTAIGTAMRDRTLQVWVVVYSVFSVVTTIFCMSLKSSLLRRLDNHLQELIVAALIQIFLFAVIFGGYTAICGRTLVAMSRGLRPKSREEGAEERAESRGLRYDA